MEPTRTNNLYTQTSIPDLKPWQKGPIKEIPKYVFENCNQVTCNDYKDFYLKALREKTKSIKAHELTKLCKGDEAQYIKKGEEFDWIYGLDALEDELMKSTSPEQFLETILKVERIMDYNALFSRFSNDAPGAFRERNIRWALYDMDPNEALATSALELELETHYGKEWFSNIPQWVHDKKEHVVKSTWINRQWNLYKNHPQSISFTDEKSKKWFQENKQKIDIPKAAEEWIKKQGREDGKLDIFKWLNERYHWFPPATTLKQDLSNSLARVVEAKDMHPIEKACRVWFDIVRIHISHEANKRTGKAIASAILLSYGYLPPKIKKEDEKEYLEAFKKGFLEPDGHLRLMEFVTKNIKRTQEEYVLIQENK